MKAIKNTLSIVIETWDDPGDYPSGAGAGPVPSYKYLAGLKGELVLLLAPIEKRDFNNSPHEFLLDTLTEYLPEAPTYQSSDIEILIIDHWKLEPKSPSLLYILTINGVDINTVAVRLEGA